MGGGEIGGGCAGGTDGGGGEGSGGNSGLGGGGDVHSGTMSQLICPEGSSTRFVPTRPKNIPSLLFVIP